MKQDDITSVNGDSLLLFIIYCYYDMTVNKRFSLLVKRRVLSEKNSFKSV